MVGPKSVPTKGESQIYDFLRNQKISTMEKLSKEEIYKNGDLISSVAFQHTDFIVSGVLNSSKYEIKGFGSCVLISYKGNEYLITCDHVLGANTLFFSGANKLNQNDRIDDQEIVQYKNLKVTARDGSMDIALLTGYPLSEKTRKKAYDIELSRFFDESLVTKNRGTLVCFIGAVGEHTRFTSWPDLIYADVCFVKGISGLGQMQNDFLIGDFAAKEIIEKRDDVFPSLKSFEATGGEVNLKGCSGCGLWGINGCVIFLLGILLGKEPGDPTTEHKIRFTPVWKILEFLDSFPS